LIERKESARVEFKSSARWNFKRGDKGKEIEDAVVKTVAGYMNRDGGTLIIGVDDDGNVLGLEKDLTTIGGNDLDGYENWMTTLFEHSFGKPRLGHLSVAFVDVEDLDLCRIDVRRSKEPVWAKTSQKDDAFYVRFGNSTRELNGEEAHKYIKDHFGITA
jgi:predicted HTH transcriptional regulator